MNMTEVYTAINEAALKGEKGRVFPKLEPTLVSNLLSNGYAVHLTQDNCFIEWSDSDEAY